MEWIVLMKFYAVENHKEKAEYEARTETHNQNVFMSLMITYLKFLKLVLKCVRKFGRDFDLNLNTKVVVLLYFSSCLKNPFCPAEMTDSLSQIQLKRETMGQI